MNFLDAMQAARKIEQAIDKLIVSNEKVAYSNEKYAKATVYLTLLIVISTLVGLAFDLFGASTTDKIFRYLAWGSLMGLLIATLPTAWEILGPKK